MQWKPFKGPASIIRLTVVQTGTVFVCACEKERERERHLVSSSKQVVGHLVQVRRFARVDETHHLLKHFGLHVVNLHSVLQKHTNTTLTSSGL